MMEPQLDGVPFSSLPISDLEQVARGRVIVTPGFEDVSDLDIAIMWAKTLLSERGR